MADLSDFVIDWLIDGFQYYYNIIIFSFIFGLLGVTYALLGSGPEGDDVL